MESRQDSQKAIERMYLEGFLELSSRSDHIQPFERPDFILTGPMGRCCVEVTRVFKRESARGGSAAKREESGRTRFLQALAKQYYSASGKPLMVRAELPAYPSAGNLLTIMNELALQRLALQPWGTKTFFGRYGAHLLTFYLTALPDNLPRYSNWTCMNDTVGWVSTIEPQLFVDRIRAKAAALTEYRKAADRVLLLIVADRTKNSGKFQLQPSFPDLDDFGFNEVHLLLHPLSVARIA